MKQLVILSGKGGTGKTSVSAALAHLATAGDRPVRAVLADADVDASNLELVLAPAVLETHDFMGGSAAVIDQQLCQGCGLCAEVCRFEAITQADGVYRVDPLACEGCAACFYQCPAQAVQRVVQQAGQWFRASSRYGPLFYAALRPAQENSGKLVMLIRQQAQALALERGFDLLIIDGPPGIGCPVISAVTGTDLALIVAEPGAAGVHDLERILATTDHFGIPTLVCINKADLYPPGTATIESFCRERQIEVVGRVPFDTAVTQAMAAGLPVTAYQDGPVRQELVRVWQRTLAAIESI